MHNVFLLGDNGVFIQYAYLMGGNKRETDHVLPGKLHYFISLR